MTFAYDDNPARVTAVTEGPDETRVDVAFDLDPVRLPWLALDPRHPVVVEKVEYLGGITALMAIGGLPAGKASALTALTWSTSDEAPVGHATRGVGRLFGSPTELVGGAPRFELSLFDAADLRFVVLTGSGVVFDAAEGGARRAAAKAKAKAATVEGPAHFAAPGEVGLSADGVSFLGPLEGDVALGLVTADGGFHPAHPFHTGSGDHVNAGHLLDVAHQFAHLVLDGPRTWAAGSARFKRFVELDVPFVVRLEHRRSEGDDEVLAISVHQLDRPCAELEGTFRRR